MYGRIIKFTVAGRDTTNEDMLVSIPRQYADEFEGHNFETMHDLSMALMHASCAAEATYYRRPWKVEEYEDCLRAVLAKAATA